MNVIEDCLVTQSDAKVLKQYCISTSSPLYKQYKGFNTSLNLSADKVYNMYAGRVATISGNSKIGFEVSVLVNQNQAIKYGNLRSITVKLNQFIDVSFQIGVANKYVSIEYMSTYIKNQYSYRVGTIQMYKDDPAKIIDITSTVMCNTSLQYSESGLYDVVDEYDGGTHLPDDLTIYNIHVHD